MTERVLIVGIGPGGRESVPPALCRRILQADRLYGAERWLTAWPDASGQRLLLDSDIAGLVSQMRERGDERVAILASGDPGFFGIASTLLKHLAPDDLEIVPHVSSLQLACARAGIASDRMVFVSAHARPLAEIAGWARRAAGLGILTDPRQTPGAIAQALLRAGSEDCRAVVAENLGLPGERIVETRLAELPQQEFAQPNVLLLLRPAGWRPAPALALRPDDAYVHRRGLITKADIRQLSLCRLEIGETDTVWDIGAGSGAMSIEMSELAWRGRVFAIEHAIQNVGCVRQNLERFGTLNVEVIEGRAPAALVGLPAPQAVFVGGSDGELPGILAHIDAVAPPGCRVVLNVVTLEHLHLAMGLTRKLGWGPQITQAGLSYSQAIGSLTRMVPSNPVHIVRGTVRPEEELT